MPEPLKLEQEIEALAHNLGVEIMKPERRGMSHKDVLREVLSQQMRVPIVVTPNAASPRTGASAENGSEFIPEYVAESAPAVRLKVKQLLDLAWHEGIVKAAREAEKEGEFYLNALRDALAEKLYEQFKQQGLIK